MTAPHAQRPFAYLRRRAAWVIALLPCLLLRGLLPPGVMVAAGAGAGVELCSLRHVGAPRNPAAPARSTAAHGDSPCPCLLGASAAPASVVPPAPPTFVRIAWLDAVRAWTPPTEWRRMLPDARGPPAVDA